MILNDNKHPLRSSTFKTKKDYSMTNPLLSREQLIQCHLEILSDASDETERSFLAKKILEIYYAEEQENGPNNEPE